MACQCIAEIDKLLAKDAEDGRQNTRLGVSVLFDRETGATREVVEIATYKRNPKSRQKAWGMTPVFCPFCGVEYAPEETNATGATTAAAVQQQGGAA